MYSDVRDYNRFKERFGGTEMWLDDDPKASSSRYVGLILEKQEDHIWDGAYNGWSCYRDKVIK